MLHCHRMEIGLLWPASRFFLDSKKGTLLTALSELSVKVVNTKDMTNVLYLRDQPRAVKHVSFDQSGSSLSVSCADGIVYVYSMSTEPPELIKKVDGLIKSLETDSESSSKVVWHPDGRAFVAPTATRGMALFASTR
jgi:chromosome transmission fidelity protein 4